MDVGDGICFATAVADDRDLSTLRDLVGVGDGVFLATAVVDGRDTTAPRGLVVVVLALRFGLSGGVLVARLLDDAVALRLRSSVCFGRAVALSVGVAAPSTLIGEACV